MHRSTVAVVAALAFALGLSPAARAGIADSPVPQLLAQDTKHLYSVPGVINRGGVGTFFSCTSALEAGSVTVGVEVFAAAGGAPINDATTTAVTLPAGGTVTFGTQSAIGVHVDQNLALAAMASNGSARIIATSKSVLCTVCAADVSNSPPISSWYLTIIAKLKQKAAN